MSDRILEAFLRKQHEQGLALAAESDLLDLIPVDVNRFVAQFYCKGLRKLDTGEVVEGNEFHVGIWFPDDYLRRASTFQVLTWLGPMDVLHPNIRPLPIHEPIPLPSAVCAGRIAAGTTLVDILFQLFDMLTYQNYATHDGLNEEACQWARNNLDRFPIDRRPLKRRKLNLNVEAVTPS